MVIHTNGIAKNPTPALDGINLLAIGPLPSTTAPLSTASIGALSAVSGFQ